MPVRNWTQNAEGVENSSAKYLECVGAVQNLILGEAHTLLGGGARASAALIVSQLAHVHGLGPRPAVPQHPPAPEGHHIVACINCRAAWIMHNTQIESCITGICDACVRGGATL